MSVAGKYAQAANELATQHHALIWYARRTGDWAEVGTAFGGPALVLHPVEGSYKYLREEDALSLARWILATFGEPS